jgi:DNA-binding beta-propeller fold protein YncE
MKAAGSLVAALFSAIVPVFAAAGGVLALGACASCQSTVRVAAMPVVAAGSFDGVVADPNTHRLYMADRTAQGIDVVDISSTTPRFMATVNLGTMPNGLALAPDQNRLFAAVDGGKVAVIDTGSGQVVNTVDVKASTVDLLDYSPRTQLVYAGTGDGGEVVTIDATTYKVRLRFAAKAPVGQPRYDPADGMLYVTTPKSNSLVQINPATGNITRTYVIPKCGPAGVAINPTRQLAMLSCGSSVGLLNLQTGAQTVTRAVQGGDIVSYDAAADRFVLASPHGGSDSAVGVFSGNGDFIGSVAAAPKAHAAAFDTAHGLVYAPGNKGLMSFVPAACAPPPDWLQFLGGLSIFVVPMLLLISVPVLYARRMRRPRDPSKPTFRDLLEEDLEAERERMRALEDGILGLEP